MIPKGSKKKIEQIKVEIENTYCDDQIPWVITYSGGKDSTMTVQIALDTVIKNTKNARKKTHILYADTRVEPPPVINNARILLEKIKSWAKEKNLPIRTKILYPETKDSFFYFNAG